jgi:opine dehydrogenase
VARRLRVGIAGAGAIGLGYAAFLTNRGHEVALWSPSGRSTAGLIAAPLLAEGQLEHSCRVRVASDAATLARDSDVLIVALPVTGHRLVMDALVPHLRSNQGIVVSSMSSLSSLYLFERAGQRGVDLTVASLATTVLTARRNGPTSVNVLAIRSEIGVSCLPRSRNHEAINLCRELFGVAFQPHVNVLATELGNVNPVAHAPLALFNWTRIERAETWPQYHYMTPSVSAVITQLDAERIELGRRCGLELDTIQEHLARSFGTPPGTLAEMAAELHRRRGGPPGPIDVSTRFIMEDVPYGLSCWLALGHLGDVPLPATTTIVRTASLLTGIDLGTRNEFVSSLLPSSASLEELLVRAGGEA